MNPRFSVLDQSPMGDGFSTADALHCTVDLAQAAEELGYVRVWVAEHHGSASFAGSAPEILAGLLLARTRNLSIGTGGVLLPRYSPVKVAEVFGVLASLFPGRVDMGIGRAGGPADDFTERVHLLRALVGIEDGLESDAYVTPRAVVPPRLWLLGAGLASAQLAGELGTDFAFAHFLAPSPAPHAFARYRKLHPAGDEAGGVLAVRVVTADTEKRAEALVQSVLLWRSRKDLGEDLPLPSPEEAVRHQWTALEAERAAVRRRHLVWGTPERVRRRLAELADEHGVEEIMVNTLTADPADRLRSYQLLAEAA
ncbi:MsnO8 family LLM class oxidoreductase [Sphaerimonospora thailandensis]|uniref:Luciferase n=1 Tax=Sphaerimonospora thailandensis TaxID=795644 RepID=A0A8J3W1C0_9ACTN|nr:MsnO8 family LLM class oxidoreductase [Sphaerimonospora thailandensis]GIH72587.1 luciferase [Sphaerimonospora thailandensis]